MYDLGTLPVNKVNFACSLIVILGLDTSTFRQVKSAHSVIPFKDISTLQRGAPLSAGIGYYHAQYNGNFRRERKYFSRLIST